jgi:anti-sigma-K factor RskA
VNEQDFAELAAGHALHALSPEDERAYDDALAANPEWEQIARADAATASALAEATLQVAPPVALRAELLARIAQTTQLGPEGLSAPAASSAGPRSAADADPAVRAEPLAGAEPPTDTATIQAISRRSWTRGLFGLAASLVLLVALGFGAVTISEQLNRPASVTALAQIQDAPDSESATVALDSGGTATAYWSGSIGKAVLVSDGLPTIASDQSYELWLVRDGTALPAGVVDEGGDVTALLDAQLQLGDAIAVTVEQAGGSSTGQPTTTPIVVIPTNA